MVSLAPLSGVFRERLSDILLESVVGSAYRMCDDQPNAVQPTHATIEATMLVDKSSRLIVPTPSPTLSTTISRSKSGPTAGDSRITVSASFSQPSSQPTETESAPSPGDAEGADSDDDEPGPSDGLSTAEIGGLAGGLAAALALAIIAICFARRRRKKHFPDLETSFFMKSERIKAMSRRFTSIPTGQNISSPLHGSPTAPPKEFPMGEYGAQGNRRRTFIFPKGAQRTVPPVRKVPSGTATPVAGLAITAASAVPTAASHSDSSTQNKQQRPVLSLAIPKNTVTSSPSQQKPGPKPHERPPKLLVTAPTFERETARNNRKAKGASERSSNSTIRAVGEGDSPLTEFEEDERDSPVQVWRPPSLDPQSATTLYVADKSGNWVLADDRQKRRLSPAELEGSSPVVTSVDNNNPASGPSNTAEPPKATGALRPPAEIHRRAEKRREMPSMTSSVYSSDIPSWNASSPPPVPTHPMLPRPLATRQDKDGPPRPRYSPVLNPFLDENGVSPVRSMWGSIRAPPRAHPSPRIGARPDRIDSPLGQPSPTLGVEGAAGRGQLSPQWTRTPQQPPTPDPRSNDPEPGSAFSTHQQGVPTSLLEKRLGPEKAASLWLRDSEGSKDRGGGSGSGSGSSRGSGGRGRLPSTPTWKPLMTPERRGDDLYLSLR